MTHHRIPHHRTTRPDDKRTRRPFRFGVVLRRIRDHISESDLADAAMFELAARGHRTVFEQLVACIISIRTRDEVSLPVALGLLSHARTPAAIAKLSVGQIDRLIRASTFHYGKAQTIQALARRTIDEFGGRLPCDAEALTSFKGVGPKCANLAVGVACGQSGISVDIHVHRVTNRWGVVKTTSPERTMHALQKILPRKYWVEINRLLVPFGKHVCTGRLPKCSTCPVVEYCRQVGVTSHH